MSNNLKTVFRGATRIQDTIQFVQDKVQEGYIVEQVTEVPLGVQIAMKRVSVEATPVDVSELLEKTNVEEAPTTEDTDIVVENVTYTVEEPTEVVSEETTETVSEDTTTEEESIDELVVDWEHVATLETSAELEDYFEPLGFNANPNHKPATIIKKAKVHFGV